MKHCGSMPMEVVHSESHVAGDLVEGCMVQRRAERTEIVMRIGDRNTVQSGRRLHGPATG